MNGDRAAPDAQSLGELVPLLYGELRRLAAAYMRRQPPGHTLQPTALVNEAYLKLAGQRGLSLTDRASFFGPAAKVPPAQLFAGRRQPRLLLEPRRQRRQRRLRFLLTYTGPVRKEKGSKMPLSRPLTDLRDRVHEISQICHESGEPVFLTEEGKEDLVMISLEAYERDQARLELYRLLDEAEEDVRKGDQGVSVATLRERLARS